MRRLINCFIVLAVGVIAIWLLSLCIEVFAAHRVGFILTWVFIPVVAVWLNSGFVQARLTRSELSATRLVLTVAAVGLSLFCFSDYNDIRDTLGRKYVSGYSVYYYEDTDSFGRTYTASRFTTAHPYSGIALWAFEWSFFLACLLLPAITWEASTRALTRRVEAHFVDESVPLEPGPG